VDAKLSLAQSELRLAAENLAAVPLLADATLYRGAISNLYYAAHHTVSALLAASGLEAGTHDGVQTQFGLHFVKPGAVEARAGKLLGQLLHARLTADYKGYVELEREDYEQAVAQAKLVIAAVVDHLERAFAGLDTADLRRRAANL
jgi:uncharacterized protein (UPF0332 family)